LEKNEEHTKFVWYENHMKKLVKTLKSGFDVTRCNNISGDLSQEASDEILQ